MVPPRSENRFARREAEPANQHVNVPYVRW